MVTIQLNDNAAEDMKYIQELRAMGVPDEKIQEYYDMNYPPNSGAKIESGELVEVVRCKDCFANGCCSIQIDLNMGEEGFCSKGRKERKCG